MISCRTARYFVSSLTVVLWLSVLSNGHAAGNAPSDTADPPDAPAWKGVIDEVPDTTFPALFIDSIKKANGYLTTKTVGKCEQPLSTRFERFVIEVGWGPINAGYGVIDFRPDTTCNRMIISIKGATNDFTSSFMKVRDYVRSTIDIAGGYPLFFEEHLQEGKYRAQRWTLFDPAQNMVFCSKKDKPSANVLGLTNDFLSLLYVVRGRTFAPGDTFTLHCFVDGQDQPTFIRIGKRKTLTVKAGTFDCIMVEPRLVGKGRNFSENDRVTLWMTDDQAHLLVQIRSKVKVGSIVGDLIYFE
jgi:hypothetical protein